MACAKADVPRQPTNMLGVGIRPWLSPCVRDAPWARNQGNADRRREW